MKLIIIGITIFFAGCCTSQKQLTGCDHPSGWCNEIRDIANKSWKYSQLSKNVYHKSFQYNVADYFNDPVVYENKPLEFYAEFYKDNSNGDYVLVFRGTDSLKDMKTGNNPLVQKQNEYALTIFDEVRNIYGEGNYIVAGHSLGGGIAIHVSLNRSDVIAYSFNGSPVFKNNNNFNNDRYSIVEHGELLKAARVFGREATQLYTSIGCTDGNPLYQHDMRILASCLTQIAAIENSAAKDSLERNGIVFNSDN
jgi:hypothetical protein